MLNESASKHDFQFFFIQLQLAMSAWMSNENLSLIRNFGDAASHTVMYYHCGRNLI